MAKKQKKKIPEFASYEEEVEFWDSTSSEDIDPDELEWVTIERPSRPLSSTFAVRFDPQTVEQLRALAEAKGVGVTQLVRTWVLQRLRAETQALPSTNGGRTQTEVERGVRDKVVKAVMARVPAVVEEATQAVLKEVGGS